MRHTLLATSGAIGIALSLLSLPRELAHAVPNMGSTPVVSATTMPALAEAVAGAIAPSSGAPVYVAPPGNSVALVQAAANASTTGGIALVAPTNYDPAILKQTLARGPVGQIRLIGPTGAFPSAFVSGLQATYTVDSGRIGARPYLWSEASVNASLRKDIVLANNSVSGSVTFAAGAAAQRGAALMIMDSSTDPAALAAILNSSSVGTIATVGGPNAFPRPDLLTQATVNKSWDYPLTDLSKIETAAIFDATRRGANAKMVVVSADSNADSVALTALYAKSAGAVLAVGGRGAVATETASKYLRLLRSQRSAMTLVGVKATTTLRNSFMAFGTVTTQATPAFRAVNTVLGTGNHTVTVTAVTGATTYRAFDAAGVQVASSTTPTLTVSGVPRPLEIRALNSMGSLLASIQYKVSEYATAEDRPAAMATSSAADIHHLVFLGATPLPRLITRTSTDPLAPLGTSPTVTQLAATCLSTFTDTAQSAAMEQQYEVVTLSNSPKSCGSTTAAAEDKVQVSGVTMPATALAVAVTGSRPMATQSRLSQAVTTASAHRTRRAPTSVAAAPGDGWAPIYFRYGAFIPEDKVWAGGLTGSFGRPFKMFHGDGRGYDPNGSTRYRFTAKATFGSTHSIEITKNVGQTIAYGCTTPWGTDCVAIQSATAPDSELSWINVSSGNTTADFTLVAAAKNPLVSIAPPIDAGVAFHLRPGGTTVRGIHDRMPVHEIYFYVEGWGEWEPVYRSDAWFLPCLGGYAVAPGCETKFSVLL